MPFALVISVSVGVPLVANTPLAPVAGAVKVTVTPLTGVWPFITDTCNFVGNTVPAARLCVVPLAAVIVSIAVPGFGELLVVLHEDSTSTMHKLARRRFAFINLNGHLRRVQLLLRNFSQP
jgi:hypothetical protein